MSFRFRRAVRAGLFAMGVVLGCAQPVDDDDGVQAVCEIDTDDSECDVCIKTGCCDSYLACQDDPSCYCVFTCGIDGETRDVCADRCGLAPAAFQQALAALDGGGQTCNVQCEDQCAVYGFADDDDGDIDTGGLDTGDIDTGI